MSDMLFITDSSGCATSINNAVTRKLGYSENDLLNKPFINILNMVNPNISLEKVIQHHADKTSNKADAIHLDRFEGSLIAKNGSNIPTDISISRLKKENDQLLGYVIIALGVLAIVGSFVNDLFGGGDFQGIGPTQRLALMGAGLFILIGLSLVPFGDKPA